MKLLKGILCSTMVVVLLFLNVSAAPVELIKNGSFTSSNSVASRENTLEAKNWIEGSALWSYITYQSTGGVNDSAYMQVTTKVAGDFNEGVYQIVSGLDKTKQYRLNFWFKADADYRRFPAIKISHSFKNINDSTNINVKIDYTNFIQAIQSSTNTEVKETLSLTRTSVSFDEPFLFESENNIWTKYTLSFKIPDYSASYPDFAYDSSAIYLGVIQSYKGTSDAKQQAYLGYDEISLTEDYTSVGVYSPSREEIKTLPASGESIVATWHDSGENSEILTFAGLYKEDESGARKLVNVLAMQKSPTTKELVFPEDKPLNFKFILPTDIKQNIDIPELEEGTQYSVDIIAWDNINNLNPLVSKAQLQ